jgi:ABC-type Mn2+/Zn2+ transport system permease subunit
LGVGIAISGFYISVQLDLPLGPTDVTLGCAVIFLIYAVQGGLLKRGFR